MKSGELHTILNYFSPITLEEMDSVKLMNRYDTKYVFSAEKLPSFLNLLKGNYKILEMCKERAFRYNTLYLDTSKYLFYNQHVTGKLSRHKVRYRTYEATGVTYLEVKRKTNKNKTLKWRLKNNSDASVLDKEASDFIQKHIFNNKLDLYPVMRNRFIRTTLVGIDTHERITIDYQMDFSAMDGKGTELPFMAVVELKRELLACHSPFRTAIRRSGIRPVAFSKYCIGNALLLDVPKKNILKQRLLLLNKIENEYSKSAGS
jgi:hypothetical protein